MRLLSSLLLSAFVWSTSASVVADNSYLYDWGVFGAYPRNHYKSFDSASPWPNVLKSDPRCDAGYLFIEPRGSSVAKPGPVILDKNGNLVWTEQKWGQAMDVKVQNYQGNDYITFWTGSDNGTFGSGNYLMIDSSYQIYKNFSAAGTLHGDLHEFRITKNGTALLTAYELKPTDLSAFGVSGEGWIYDSLFQEVDIATGKLLFQWRASDHLPVTESFSPIQKNGRERKKAWDYMHINSVDKNDEGNYLISLRYGCTLLCISQTGEILWRLGGKHNSFKDLTPGAAATNFAWQHHAMWHENSTMVSVFDNGAFDKLIHTAEYSRGLLISLDYDAMTATLVQDYVAPQRFLAPSQGSVQLLPDGNVLVGWGHTPAFTEFSASGEVLCDMHIGATRIASLGRSKNYRTFKYSWVGRPKTAPSVVLKSAENALYVSWNGATEVERWVLEASDSTTEDAKFFQIGGSFKEQFETKIHVPQDADEYLRVAAIDEQGNVLGYSGIVDKKSAEVAGSKAETILAGIVCVSLGLFLWRFRGALRSSFYRISQRAFGTKYKKLPQS